MSHSSRRATLTASGFTIPAAFWYRHGICLPKNNLSVNLKHTWCIFSADHALAKSLRQEDPQHKPRVITRNTVRPHWQGFTGGNQVGGPELYSRE